MQAQQLRTVALVSGTLPNEPVKIPDWLARLNGQNTRYAVAFIDSLPTVGEVPPIVGDNALIELYRSNVSTPEFAKGFDNVAYEEVFRSTLNWKVNDTPNALFFAPALDSTNGSVRGVLLFFFDLSEETAYLNLVYLLFGRFL